MLWEEGGEQVIGEGVEYGMVMDWNQDARAMQDSVPVPDSLAPDQDHGLEADHLAQ